MNARNVKFAALLAWLCAGTAFGTTIVPDFVKAEMAPNSTQVSLPELLDETNDIVFLKFKIPNFSQIASIESFVIFVDLYDDGDGVGDFGDIEFAQPGTNLILTAFATLNHTDAAHSALFVLPLCPCEISQLAPSLQDGNFRIRIAEDKGDFFVGGATAVMDVTLTPEPATIGSLACALLLFGAMRRRLQTSIRVSNLR